MGPSKYEIFSYKNFQIYGSYILLLSDVVYIYIASCPGSRGGGEREPGTHRSCMCLIISNFCRFLRYRRLPTAMIRNNINKLAAKLLSFVGLY